MELKAGTTGLLPVLCAPRRVVRDEPPDRVLWSIFFFHWPTPEETGHSSM
jgi:hypothetical protein